MQDIGVIIAFVVILSVLGVCAWFALKLYEAEQRHSANSWPNNRQQSLGDSEMVVRMAYAFRDNDLSEAAHLWDEYPQFSVKRLVEAMRLARHNNMLWLGQTVDEGLIKEWRKFLFASLKLSRRDYVLQMQDRMKERGG